MMSKTFITLLLCSIAVTVAAKTQPSKMNANSMVLFDDIWESFIEPIETPTRHLQVEVEVTECQDATEFFRRSWDRRYGGINILDEFYDCSCDGDIASSFTMTCLLQNHCFVPVDYDESSAAASKAGFETMMTTEDSEICLHHRVEFNFEVDNSADTNILNIIRQTTCSEFIKNGPPAPNNIFCYSLAPTCPIILVDTYGYSTSNAVKVCNDQSLCPNFLQETLGFPADQAVALCPQSTLGGQPCRTNIGTNVSVLCIGERDENLIYSTLADCGNIEECAQASCYLVPYQATIDNVAFFYRNCTGLDVDEVEEGLNFNETADMENTDGESDADSEAVRVDDAETDGDVDGDTDGVTDGGGDRDGGGGTDNNEEGDNEASSGMCCSISMNRLTVAVCQSFLFILMFGC